MPTVNDTLFPDDIAYGATFSPGYETSVSESASGIEARVILRESAKREFNVSKGITTQTDLATVLTFHHAHRGRGYGFRFKDWSDFTTASDHYSTPANSDQLLGAGDASETEFQLIKKYTSGSLTATRNLTYIVLDTDVVAVDGVAQTRGVDYTINLITGKVTFASAPALGLEVTAGAEFDVPCRFESDNLDLTITDFEAGNLPRVGIVEILDTTQIVDDQYHGGWYSHGTVSADVNITPTLGLGQTFNPDANGHKIILPDETAQAQGSPIFILYNASATYTIGIYDNDGTTLIHLLATKEGKEVCVRKSAAGTATWDTID